MMIFRRSISGLLLAYSTKKDVAANKLIYKLSKYGEIVDQRLESNLISTFLDTSGADAVDVKQLVCENDVKLKEFLQNNQSFKDTNIKDEKFLQILLMGVSESESDAKYSITSKNPLPSPHHQNEILRNSIAKCIKLFYANAKESDFFAIDPSLDAKLVSESSCLVLDALQNKWLKNKEVKKTKKQQQNLKPESIFSIAWPDEATAAKWNEGKIMAESQSFAAFLMESPSNHMTPTIFVERVLKEINEKLSCPSRIKTRLHSMEEIRDKYKMGAFMAVAQGSVEEPKFMELFYEGSPSAEVITFIGKGVTFDSGGISLKPSAGMDQMRGDMGGAAVVVATLLGVARLQLPLNVRVLVPLCENMPSGSAVKPGDVITAMNGTTIEIDNTDAEGRLLLADAITFALETQPLQQSGKLFKVKSLIDVATLTGAIDVALGPVTSGLFCNSDELYKGIQTASHISGDPVWLMPLWDNYRKIMKSSIADVRNASNSRSAGSCTAAAFLKYFIDDKTPWAHLDIAGVMNWNSKFWEASYGASGMMTGRPTRLLIEYCKGISSSSF